jgi:hypothetical protein
MNLCGVKNAGTAGACGLASVTGSIVSNAWEGKYQYGRS